MKHADDQYQNPLPKRNDELRRTEQPSSGAISITGVPLNILILDKSKVAQLQWHFTKLRIHSSILKRSSSEKEPLLEALDNHSLQLSCKKQKVPVTIHEQGIKEDSNNITALGGASIREEDEQLLLGHMEESRISQEAQTVVEEEERLILQRIPLQRKLAEIISKYGITRISNNVEQCLSMRVDRGKAVQQTSMTSDAQLETLMMDCKAKELSEKCQDEDDVIPQKHNKLVEFFSLSVTTFLNVQADKVGVDNLRTATANAVRTAVGGVDILLKWQLMTEQARQKREGRTCAVRGAQLGSDAILPTSKQPAWESHEPENRSSLGSSENSGRHSKSQTKPVRRIFVRDVVTVLEREPQMARSTLIYRLYEGMHTDTGTCK
ncbi:hypothetical protein IFM89_035437 [Coptis chinensis]|uniref:Transcription initiation factor TFIID component TAF4 C-terminal domain-containing protein n=1 Tax=Coptis chinensis TaxID=261450 RepID=A0A835HLM6_9MAGN|nr:hypothetical protein IFM89_035437 [Coptis chinensis]